MNYELKKQEQHCLLSIHYQMSGCIACKPRTGTDDTEINEVHGSILTRKSLLL